jgi:predicted MFS family arabinose efflux permease
MGPRPRFLRRGSTASKHRGEAGEQRRALRPRLWQGFERLEDRVEEPGEASVEGGAVEVDEARPALQPGAGDPGFAQDVEVVGHGRLVDGDALVEAGAVPLVAVGTDGFVFAGLLPAIGSDLDITTAAAGQLITVFAIAYALAMPILGALTGNVDRRRILLAGLAVFIAGNVATALATDFGFALAARVLTALGGALITPQASAVAAAIAPPERRGRYLAVIMGGLTAATALGVPLGTLIGAVVGNLVAGRLVDRFGPERLLLAAQTAYTALLSLTPLAIGSLAVAIPFALVFGTVGWATIVPQQHRLVTRHPQAATILIGLNGSALYAGIALGGLIGGLSLNWLPASALGFVGAAIGVIGIAMTAAHLRAKPTLATAEA